MKKIMILLLVLVGTKLQAQTEDQKILHSDRASNDQFGHSVVISGDYALVGAVGEDHDIVGLDPKELAGSVYIYKRDAMGVWQQLRKIVASNRASPDQFGYSLAISGDIAVVGAHLKYTDGETIGEAGTAYVFQKDLGGTDNWGEVKQLLASDRAELDVFGTSVGISGDYIVVGAPHEDEDGAGLNTNERAGSAYIFKRDLGGTDNWGELKKIVALDRDDSDEFGWSVAISGNYIVVGARSDEHNANGSDPLSDAGSAYLFEKDRGGTDNWGQKKKLIPSERFTNHDFGGSVSISGDNILVGATGRAGYIFNKDEGEIDAWEEVQRLLPEDLPSNSAFGESVMINGNYAVIGSPSNDFDQNEENELDGAGAAYLYRYDGSNWIEIQKVVASDRGAGDRFGDAVAIESTGEFIVGAPRQEDPGLMESDAGSGYIFESKTIQTIIFDALPDKTYGDDAFQLVAISSSGLPVTFTTANASSGIMFDENPAPTVATVSGNTVTIVTGGVIDIIATQTGNEDNWAVQATQSLTVNKAIVTATADDQSRDYRGTDPDFTISYTGFVNGEDESDLDFLPEAEVNVNEETGVGEYVIEVNGGFDEGYDFNRVNGTLTINRIPATVTADSYTIEYGDFPPEDPTYTITGEADPGDISGDPTITINTDEFTDIGSYPIEISGLSNNNYNITFVNGTLNIDPAPLTATADDKVITYGDEAPEYTVSYSGFKNGENETEFVEAPMVGSNAEELTVGTYPISVSGGSIQNYTISYGEGALTVDPATLVVTADDKSITYGDPLVDYTISYSGFVNGEDERVLLTEPFVGMESTPVNVGDYGIFVSGGSAENYTLERVGGTFTIDPAALTATANNQTRMYGEDNPELTFNYVGFVNDEDESVLESTPTITTEATTTSSTGTYPITLSGGSALNYTLSLIDGTLTVNQVALTVSADDQTKTYGDEIPVLTLGYTGFVNGENVSVIESEPVASTEADATSNVGTYPISLTGGSAQNYSFTLVEGTLTVSKASLTTIAEDKSKSYGESNPTLGISYDGFVNGDDESDLDTTPAPTTTVDESSTVGTYAISVSGGEDNNYEFAYVNGSMEVEPAPLTVTADDLSKTYGEENPIPTISYAGFVNGEDNNDLESAPSANTEADVASTVGTYAITVSGGSAQNYSLTRVDGTLTINQAALTATADDLDKVYGEENPTLTFSYAGFVNGEDASVIENGPTISTQANATSGAGDYPITLSGGSAQNYSLMLVDGVLTVNKASLTAQADDQSKTYGEENPTFMISYTGFVNEDDATMIDSAPAASTEADASSDVGTYPINLDGGEDNNYLITHVGGTLTIEKAVLAATADDQIITNGEELPTFTVSYVGFVNGDNSAVLDEAPIASVEITDTNTSGTYPIVFISEGLDNNYTFTYETGELTISEALGMIEELDIKVYPNPVVNYITISESSVKYIELFDMRGARVYNNVVEGSVDLSQLGRGNYLIRLKDANQTIIYTGRIIKN